MDKDIKQFINFILNMTRNTGSLKTKASALPNDYE